MDAGEKHIGAFVKNRLRAIAVVVVHVQHGHALKATVTQVLRSQRRVIQETVTTKKICACVMARRAAQRKRGAPALGNMRCRTERAIGPATRGLPGACGQRRTGIKRIKPHARGEIVRLDVGAKTARGPDAGNCV